MPLLPDVTCSIKVTQKPNGNLVNNGAQIGPGMVTVQYVVKNAGTKSTGPLTVVGSLYRDGVKVQPNVVPAQQLRNLEPGQQREWKHDVTEGGKGLIKYSARMLGDVGDFVNESNESNNKAKFDFAFLHIT